MMDDKARLLEADDGDEKTDADGDAVLEAVGNGAHDAFAETEEREDDEQRPGDEHGAEGRLPGIALDAADEEHEEGVVAHGRCEGDRVSGEQPHDNRRQRAGKARGHHHRAEVHVARIETQQAGLDEDDVGHRHEGDQAGAEFGADGRAQFVKAEVTANRIDHSLPSLISPRDLPAAPCAHQPTRGMAAAQGDLPGA